MLKELLSILRAKSTPLEAVTDDFEHMLALSKEMTLEASKVFWGKHQSPEERTALYEKDVLVNKLERKIRKGLVSHLSLREPADVPYCLLLMSLIKDLERIGDYAKNLTELVDIAQGPFPEDETVAELREIRKGAESLARQAPRAFSSNDRSLAIDLTLEGRALSKRCDAIIDEIAHSTYTAPIVVTLTLGARFYKRLVGHMLNVLSGVLMPLHKVDYFDEELVSGGQ